jgi:tripartite-type tricarboxylate transporter receptor subunit TctC
MITRREFASIAAGGALTAATSPAWAQAYPARPITLIVPWAAGGPTDIVLRAMGEVAQKHLGQPVIIDSRAGGGGTVAPSVMAATAKPDGYTVCQLPDSVYRMYLMQKTTYQPLEDFTYIISLSGYAYGLIVPADSPFKVWQDVIDFAKANPGRLTVGTPGAGSSHHIGIERIMKASGIKLVHVPFKGGAEVNTAVAGGHVMMGGSGTSAKPLADGGKIRFIQIWTRRRLATLPDVPTLRDCGYPFEIESPIGLAGPKGMDPKIVEKIHDAFKLSLDDPGVLAVLQKYELLVNYMTSADYRQYIATSMETETAIFKDVGLARADL